MLRSVAVPACGGLVPARVAGKMAAVRGRWEQEVEVEFDVVIEVPKGSRNKYEVDHESGRLRLDRTLFTRDPVSSRLWLH